MALQLNFEKNALGLPVPKCYARIEAIKIEDLSHTLKMSVACYRDEEARLDSYSEKAHALEERLAAKTEQYLAIEATVRSYMAKEVQTLADAEAIEEAARAQALVGAEIDQLQKDKESLSGTKPFYRQVFEVPLSDEEFNQIKTLAYNKLKTINFRGTDNGIDVEADFTIAKGV